MRPEPLPLTYDVVTLVNEPLLRPSCNGRLSCYIPRPFTRLFYRSWLRDRPQPDVLKLLLDAFRLYTVMGTNVPTLARTPELYKNAPDGITGFRCFMTAATAKHWLLPGWWTANDQADAERIGMDPSDMNW